METAPNTEGVDQIYIPADFLWHHFPIHAQKIDVPVGGPLGAILNTPISVINYEPDPDFQEEFLDAGTEVWVLLFLGSEVYLQKPESPLFAVVPRECIDEP